MNKLDEQYRALLAEVVWNGTEKKDRTGTGTLSRFGMTIRHDMSDGFPILTTKKVAFKTMAGLSSSLFKEQRLLERLKGSMGITLFGKYSEKHLLNASLSINEFSFT